MPVKEKLTSLTGVLFGSPGILCSFNYFILFFDFALGTEESLWTFSRGFHLPTELRCAIATKALLRVQFLLTFLGGGGESALLRKKEGSQQSQQKFDFFSYDDMPYSFSITGP